MFTLTKRSIYCLGLLCLLTVISVGLLYIVQTINSQSNQTAENKILSTLKPAPEGYQWYVTEEGGFAFLYDGSDRVNVCDDITLCNLLLRTVQGGLIINTNYDKKIIPGGKGGGVIWDEIGETGGPIEYLYGIGITYLEIESDLTSEQAEAYIRDNYSNRDGSQPIIFTEQERGTYKADYMKPLPPVFLITRAGVFKIGTFANDPLQTDYDIELCTTESQMYGGNCTYRNYEGYAELPEYINTIVQSFTVIE